MLKNLSRPRWIALTLFLIGLIYLFLRLSEWQMDRYDQRILSNNTITKALNSEAKQIKSSMELKNLKTWEKVQLSGSFLNDDSMLVRKQYLGSKLGFWVITPFQIENNDLILINRGWIPIASSSSAVEEIPTAPQGLVKIKGYLQKFSNFVEKPSDLPKNQLNQINYQDFSSDLNKDYYVQLNESFPQDREIAIIPLPELSNGPHLSYAIQWILFALLLPIGWFVLLRNEAK